MMSAHAGVDAAAARLVKHQFIQRRQQRRTPVDTVFPVVQVLTNADNWRAIQLSSYLAAAAAVLRVSHPVLGGVLLTCSAYAMPHASGAALLLTSLPQRAFACAALYAAPHKRLLASASSTVVMTSLQQPLRLACCDDSVVAQASLPRRALSRTSQTLANASHAVKHTTERVLVGAGRKVDGLFGRARRRSHLAPELPILRVRAHPQLASISAAMAECAASCRLQERIAPVARCGQQLGAALQSAPSRAGQCLASSAALASNVQPALQSAVSKAGAVTHGIMGGLLWRSHDSALR
jgi:hypothetical protein